MFARSNDLRAAWTFRPRLSMRGILDRLVALDALYRQRRTLASLDDRMLRDIGVTRAEVDEEIKRPLRF
ncbi:DUF1127 domain-containing protein [Amaricoccus solimangrovi]|uniref:DUF1127 domain-containing protein n=1 Tax=Amaricoccus solimangrovi TaxID=2589815 RepID=A0A501WIR2_9RHOB|nr:DUF1127 domain-containing protein [Amaricoccus solimangrovi]TPE48315.1 DUF1127 domain-containing protein [Amaricoccus solimangrovi]